MKEERSVGHTRAEQSEVFAEDHGLRALGDEEKGLLAEHVPVPEGGRALDVCLGGVDEFADLLVGPFWAIGAGEERGIRFMGKSPVR
ncbi:hypothetical protein [Streptomyces sp. NPDC056987]|uniref:hypothetical protein n=1 Tax=Streptomyces sp. NPDC056987 TaxID=3345988 RepID=UPI00363F8A19